VGTTLRDPYEVRDEKLYFEDLPELKLPKDMLDLAAHIVETKSGHFDPSQSFCRLYDALSQLFAECSVPCEHLTAEIPIERLIFGIRSLSLVASSSNSARPLRFSSISVAPVATVKTTAKITTRGVLYFAMS
jgi:DNA end-binding protein Ku